MVVEPILSGDIILYPVPTETHFENILSKLQNLLDLEKDLTPIAKELESLLSLLKNSNNSNDPVWLAIKQRINTYLGFTSVDKLFRRSGGKQSWLTGDYFEREMTGLIQALIDYKLNQNTTRGNYVKGTNSKHKKLSSPFLTGAVKGTVFLDTNFNVEDIVSNLDQPIPQEVIQTIVKNGIDQKRYNGLAVPEIRDIKTDIRGQNISQLGININWNAGNPLERLGQILTSYSFSLKSYADLNKISLGHSNPFKAYAGVLQQLGYSDTAIVESYLRIQCCYINSIKISGPDKHDDHRAIISNGMSKIKSVFELIGLGIVTLEGWADKVDFLIVNQHTSDIIRVFSTNALAKQFLKGQNFTIAGKNPFKQQSIKISVAI